MIFFETEILSNSILDWLITLIIATGVFFCVKALLRAAERRFKKKAVETKNQLDDLAFNILEQTKTILLLIASLYIGIQRLVIPEVVEEVINKLIIMFIALQVGFWLSGLINFFIEKKTDQSSEDKSKKTTIHAFGLFGKILIWLIVSLVVLENVTGVDMDALITSLGIGGIAIGLAIQNILKDIFASLSIYLDKPFLVGDYIVVDDIGGTVQSIGIKSTRVKTLLGEEVIFANSDLLESRVHNFQKLERRRECMEIGISVDTEYKDLCRLPEIFAQSIQDQDLVHFERAHLARLGEYSYMYEIVYYIESSDYTQYMDAKQDVYLEIVKRLQEQHIEMPYPTKSILFKK